MNSKPAIVVGRSRVVHAMPTWATEAPGWHPGTKLTIKSKIGRDDYKVHYCDPRGPHGYLERTGFALRTYTKEVAQDGR